MASDDDKGGAVEAGDPSEVSAVSLRAREIDADLEELDRLLDLASEIQARIGRHSVQGFTGLGLLVSFIGLGTLGVIVTDYGTPNLWMTVGASWVGVSIVLVRLLRLNRWLAQEERSLEEVLDVAREVEQSLASSGHMRPLPRARIRMRLAQFSLPRKHSMPPVVRAILSGGG
ncbi:MAG: hypothetical protein AB1Z98_28625 [Nannocystaceae bacterium]